MRSVSPIRVLLVDDDSTITMLCRMLLERMGDFVVAEEDNAIRAVETARKFQPDIIFLDRSLPGKTGCQIAADFQADQELKSIPLAYLTGGLSREETSTGFYGGLPTLRKPFNPEDFAEMIKSLTAPRRTASTPIPSLSTQAAA
jgi:two-component system OmpR family response regulator